MICAVMVMVAQAIASDLCGNGNGNGNGGYVYMHLSLSGVWARVGSENPENPENRFPHKTIKRCHLISGHY